jgi:hypothetical protein
LLGEIGQRSQLPETRDKSQVEAEDILEPLDGSSGLVGQDLDQIRASQVPGRLDGVVVELLDAVGDLKIDLSSCESAIDSRCGLGRVTTHEVWIDKSARHLTQIIADVLFLSSSSTLPPER